MSYYSISDSFIFASSSNIILMSVSDHITWSSVPLNLLLKSVSRNDQCTNSVLEGGAMIVQNEAIQQDLCY